MPAKPPFFILGCPRSGTTLLQILIDSHPDIAIPPESFIFDRFGPILHTYGSLADPANRLALAADILADERIRDWSLTATPEQLRARARDPGAAGLIDAVFSLYAEQSGKTRWGDKTPQHALCLTALLAVFPQARLIHLVRDGRDVAESTARIPIGPSSILAIARRWKRYMDTVRDAAAGLPPDQFLEIRFEDLVRDPAGVRRRILEFLGEDDSRCPPIDQELPQTDTRNRSAGYAHHASLRTAITASKIGVFKNAFPPRQIELFEAVAGDALLRHGYTPIHANPRPPTSAEEFAAFVTDHTVRYLRKFRQPDARRQLARELRLALQHAFRIRYRLWCRHGA